jgi:hypothetical protein
MLGGTHLVLLALDRGAREALMGSIRRTPGLTSLPVVALVSSRDEAPRGDGPISSISWPCRTADLSRAIEAVLSRNGSGESP